MRLSENSCVENTSYDRFFRDNYETLQRWALQITRYDRELAEDLVHDVYIRFNQRDEMPGDVESVHGYLYVALRNAYVSYLRLKTRSGSRQLSLLDHEFADNAWLITDPRSTIKVHDDLHAICEFACARKASSISASILILRFFHGYFSAEVAKVVKRSRNAVDARLLKARREVTIHLSEPSKMESAKNTRAIPPEQLVKSRNDLLGELRRRVFSAVDGRCLSREMMYVFYKKANSGLPRTELSHLVSCEKCLDMVNALLLMPGLSDRHPLDTLGPQTVVEPLQCNQARAAFAAMWWISTTWILCLDSSLDAILNLL